MVTANALSPGRGRLVLETHGNESAAVLEPPVVCFPFTGGVAGGSHVSAFKLIQSLDRAIVKPLVVLHHECGEVQRMLCAERIAYELAPVADHFGASPGVEKADSPFAVARKLRAQVALARFVRRRGVRIVHTNDGAMHATWAVPAKLGGAWHVWHHRGNPLAKGLRFLAPVVADRIVGVSRFALGDQRLRRSDRYSVIPSPFDTEFPDIDREQARRSLVAELNVPPETYVIGFFGNFVQRKRPLLFVDTIAQMARSYPDVPVIGAMFGSDADEGLMQATAIRAERAGIPSRVRLLGFRYPGARWMAACDVNLVTAVEEPFGRSLIEAMLLGTAVVAVRSGGNIEAIDHQETGLLAAPEDASDIAAQLAGLLRDPDMRARLVSAARSKARMRFGREQHCAAITDLYMTLLNC